MIHGLFLLDKDLVNLDFKVWKVSQTVLYTNLRKSKSGERILRLSSHLGDLQNRKRHDAVIEARILLGVS
jgi:hypothetical protein